MDWHLNKNLKIVDAVKKNLRIYSKHIQSV